MDTCKDLIPYKSFPWHGKVVLPLFIIFGSILFVITVGPYNVDNTASFNCSPDKNIATDLTKKTFIQTSCLSKYEEKYNSSIPLEWCIFLSLGLAVSVSLVYAVGVKSRVDKIDTSLANTITDTELQPLQQNSASGHTSNSKSHIGVFHFYVAQLLFARIIPTTLVASLVFFRAQYPTKFSCTSFSPSSSITDSFSRPNFSSVTVECTNLIASKYEAFAMVAGIVNTVFALLALPEAIYLVWKACGNKLFSSDREFCSVYLLRKKEEHHIMEHNYKELLNRIIDCYKEQLKTRDCTFKMDIHHVPKGSLHDMYVPLITQEGRDEMSGHRGTSTERHEIYDTYLNIPDKSLLVHDTKDLFENTPQPPHTILVIGRPGIGKSVLARKILFDWTEEIGQFYQDKIVILLNFRSFNSEQNKLKSLKEMLKIGFGLPDDNSNFDCLFQHMLKNPEKVLLIFDGLDELKVDRDCFQVAQDAPNDHCKSMSIFSIWYKLITKAFLPGATVITTSRPTVDHIFSKLSKSFDQTLEILGFTELQVKEYVENFCREREVESVVIWNYIKASAELVSLCYVPINSYVVCLTLERCERNKASIPKTLTQLYKSVVRILLWDHHPSCKTELKPKCYLNSNTKFPPDVIELLEMLKYLAIMGMENNRMIFNEEDIESIENCGLFNSLPNEYESQFCFLHLTLQEFLAAWKLLDQCCGSNDVEDVLSKKLGKPRWHLVIQFFAGLLRDQVEAGKLSKDCYKCFSKRIPSDVKSWKERSKDVLLMIKCLHELQDQELIASTADKVVLEEDDYQITFRRTDNCQIFPADCAAFSQFLSHINNLHRLDLHCQRIGDSGCRELVSTCNKLAEVNLYRNQVTDKGVKDLSEELKNKNCKLTAIGLAGNDITDKGVEDLSEALKNDNCKLTSIQLVGNEITDEGVKDLSEALKNENCKLTNIQLGSHAITDKGINDLSKALKNENCKLTCVVLVRCDITDEGVKDLGEVLKNENCKLTSIQLGRNKITGEGVKDLSDALKNENCKLTSIHLGGNAITDEGVEDLSEALKNENCKLTSIQLGRNVITDGGVKDLSKALKNKNCKLTSIELGGNKITDEGVKDLSEAVKNENCKLTSILLGRNKITNVGVKDLSEALKNENCKLTSLHLGGNAITDEGVKYLSEALKNENCKLTSIQLGGNKITDGGVKDLSEALMNENCKLTNIQLGGNAITDEGLKDLSEAKRDGNCKLTYLDL